MTELRKGPPDDWIDTAQLVDGCVTTPKLADGVVTTAKLGNDIVTYAKLQNISATARLLGRKSASAGDAEECTLSEALDFVGSATRGDLLMRGASTWGRLAPDTSGLFLKSNGAGGDLSWDAPASGSALLTSGSVASASSLDIVLTSYTGYRGLIFMLANFLPVTDGVTLMLRVSTNATLQAMNNSTSNRISFVMGLLEDTCYGSLVHAGSVGGGFITTGIGYDTTASISGRSGFHNLTSNAVPIFGDYATACLGFHYFQAIESHQSGGAPNATMFGDSGVANVQNRAGGGAVDVRPSWVLLAALAFLLAVVAALAAATPAPA